MRQIQSSGSVKAFFLNRAELIKKTKGVAQEAGVTFPHIQEILLFGSLSRHEETGLSDIDLCIIASNLPVNPIDRLKLFYSFFAHRLPIALDLLVLFPEEKELHEEYLKRAVVLYSKKLLQ